MFKTERLCFSITCEDDLQNLHETLNDHLMAQSIFFVSYPYKMEDAKNWINKAQNGFINQSEWLFSARLQNNGKYIGNINLHKEDVSSAEIGYWVNRSFHGQGMGQEMLKGALEFGFKNLRLERIFATTSLENIASQKILQKHGFVKTKQIVLETAKRSRPSYLFEIYNN